jgi:hypothetical protein
MKLRVTMFNPFRGLLDAIWTPFDLLGDSPEKDLLELAYLNYITRLMRARQIATKLSVQELEELFDQYPELQNDAELQRIYARKKGDEYGS